MDWDGLIELYAEKITASESVKSKGSRLRNMFRKDASLPSTLHSLTEMIPDDNGLSVLRVGLAYIFLVSPIRATSETATILRGPIRLISH